MHENINETKILRIKTFKLIYSWVNYLLFFNQINASVQNLNEIKTYPKASLKKIKPISNKTST